MTNNLDYLGTALYNSTINTPVNEEETTMPKPMTEEQRKRAQQYHIEWSKTHTVRVPISLVTTTDADILTWLDAQPNKQGYIKSLIRADIAAHKKEEE